jgi:hypothetical protein
MMDKRVVVIGDVHGRWWALEELLVKTGASDEMGFKDPDTHVIFVGDIANLGHGTRKQDTLALDTAIAYGDEFILGNHEAPFVVHGMSGFAGMHRPSSLDDGTQYALRALRSRWQAATSVDGWLITHAGLHPHWQERFPEIPENAARELNERLAITMKGGARFEVIEAIGSYRGGSGEFGGVLWMDAWELMEDLDDNHIKQVFGHTALRSTFNPSVDNRPRCIENQFWMVDVGSGEDGCLGALVREPGEDWIPMSVFVKDPFN